MLVLAAPSPRRTKLDLFNREVQFSFGHFFEIVLPSVEGARQVILPRGRRTRSDVPEFGMGVFAAPHLCEYAEMGNDLSGCMDRMLTENAPVKPGRPGDCLATRAGDDRGWNGARPTPPTRQS